MKDKIYHVSRIPNLKILEPHVCAHQHAYVYASYHLETALLFGGELWSDWDFIYKRNYDTGEVTFSETYPNIFSKIFEDKKCYLYEVEDSGFLQGQTRMWDEIVSKKPTKVIHEHKIENLAEAIRKLEEENIIRIELFSDIEGYKEKIKKHILNLKKYSDINRQNNSNILVEQFKDIFENFNLQNQWHNNDYR